MTDRVFLPQDDPDAQARADALRAVREAFVRDPDKLPPLSVTGEVPDDAKPSLRWFVTAGKVAARISLNLIANKRAALGSTLLNFSDEDIPSDAVLLDQEDQQEELLELLEELEEEDLDPSLDDAGAPLSFGGFGGLKLSKLADGVDRQLRGILLGLSEPGMHLFNEEATSYAYDLLTPGERPESVKEYRALLRRLDVPTLADHPPDDALFVHKRLAGPNPDFIKVLRELPDKLPLQQEHLEAACPGDQLERALAEGRLFISDYAALDAVLHPCTSRQGVPMYFYAPMAVFVAPPGGGDLRPVAIQCTQTPGKDSPLFTPQHGWRWAQARTVVEVADAIYFEAITHLGLTHLVIEHVALATRHQLAPSHPVNRLLLPHFEGTLNVNDQAVRFMVVGGGTVDQTFGATIESVRGLAAHGFANMNFREEMLPDTFRSRGTDDPNRVPGYAYRDDALPLWHAIERWVRSYVMHVYSSEAALVGDTELRAWAKLLDGPIPQGGVPGFGSIGSRDELVQVLTRVLFTCSAQHAASNFPQWENMGVASGMSGACWAPAPTTTEGGSEQEWLAMLPPLSMAQLQTEFVHLLGSVYHTRLGEYRSRAWPYRDWFQDPKITKELLPAFRADLAQVEKDTQARDQLRRFSYPHLLPSRVPQSINI